MSGNQTDFDIDNYNIQELVSIIGLASEVPLTNEKIVSRISVLKEKFNENSDEEQTQEIKDNFLDFFDKIQEKLLKSKKDETMDDLFEKKDAEMDDYGRLTRKPVVIDSRQPRQAELYDKDIMGETRIQGLINPQPFHAFSQGDTNPILRNIVFKTIDINSSDRQNFISSFVCENGAVQEFFRVKRVDKPSNFTVNINPPIKNVISILFNQATIPHSWYVFSEDYGTNYFTVKDLTNNTEQTIVIDSGNYTKQELISEIEDKLQNNNIDISFNFKPRQNKVEIENKRENDNDGYDLIWYSPKPSSCTGGGKGAKMDYNLGWLLGFRDISSTIQTYGSKVLSESVMDVTGTRHVFITMDDFNPNKPTQEMITVSVDDENFKMPNYYIPPTMNRAARNCEENQVASENVTGCGVKYKDPNKFENLSRAKRYTIDQIRQAQVGRKVDRYYSSNISDILTKVPLTSLVTPGVGQTNYINTRFGINNLEYFGPVTLRKLKIRLLNDKGLELNMNDQDWSFSFQVKTIYQL